jgi:hypothetical protein
MMIARVFPRRTAATPNDAYAFIGDPPLWLPADIDAVHVSVAFTYDLPEAERLAQAWQHIAPVTIGGPATGMRGEWFVPGRYVREGYTITSRGCPNRCWFCSVWKRDGNIRELPIRDGWNVLDDNLLACSESHIRSVFAMLKRQQQRAEFTGGLEAKLLKPWHVELLAELNPKRLYFAYDTADDWEPLAEAARLLHGTRLIEPSHAASCYCLIGWPKDTMDAAEQRLRQVLELGITPMAMLWRDKDGRTDPEWRRFQRRWARPHIVRSATRVPHSVTAQALMRLECGV